MKKPFLITFIIGLVLLGFFYLLPLLVNSYLNNNAERIVSNMIVRTNEFAGHEVNFGKIRLDYNYQGTFLKMDSVNIQPGEELMEEDKIKFNLTFKEASLTGFRWVDFLFYNSIKLDSAYIEDVVLETITPDLEEIADKMGEENGNQGENYKKIGVNHFRINKASFENRDSETDSTRLLINDLFIFADGFSLSEQDLESQEALFTVNTIEGYLGEVQLHVNDYINVVEANDISFNTTEQKLSIEKAAFKNKLLKYSYINRFEKETNWMEFNNAQLEISGMDFQSYFREGKIAADKVQLDHLELEVFRDKRKVEDTSKRPKMVHDIIKGLPKSIWLKAINFENTSITYQERPDTKAPSSGKIFFDQVNGEILGFTNYADKLALNDTLRMNVKGRLMGEGQIDLQANYLINDEDGRFLLEGTVGQMDLTSLNNMIMPATRVALDQGRLDKLDFNIVANDIDGTGDVIARYSDLKIEILDKDYKRNKNVFRNIGAFLANKLVIRTHNPQKSGDLQKGEVYFRRAEHKFIFHYWWNLVLSGLKSTITGDTEQDLREKQTN
ncbi:hypothetical protein [uncultured Cyclobacterium sp.]|uniref:hypothetical protein n=1 Tax=uncultured Cyclobacterium sp. TaxID=453820 RepID=UPI0030EDAE2F